MRSKLTLAMAGAALFAGSALAVPAAAEDRTVPVSYADLNLETAEGKAKLDQRVRRAARQACSAPGRSLAETAAQYACYRLAMERSSVEVASLIRQHALGG